MSLPFKPERALLLFLHKNHEPVLKRMLLSIELRFYKVWSNISRTGPQSLFVLIFPTCPGSFHMTVTSQSTPSTCSVPCHLKLSQNKHHFPFWTGPYSTRRIWLANNAVWFMNADRCQHVAIIRRSLCQWAQLEETRPDWLFVFWLYRYRAGRLLSANVTVKCEFAGRNRYAIFNNLSQLIVTLWETDCI